jgi:nitroreductase
VGVDKRLYGALSEFEECMFLDAGAAITQMVLFADQIGLGTSWNHFGLDLINSREINKNLYANFSAKLNIPDYIVPVAILSIGKPFLIPPKPERMEIEKYIL